jgi:uncharacterized protein (DUF58 family)
MITARGWWFLVFSVLVAFIGVIGLARFSATVPLVGLSLLAWFFWEWISFSRRAYVQRDLIRVDRKLIQGGREVPTAWAGTTITVQVTITNCGSTSWPFAIVTDPLPIEMNKPKYQERHALRLSVEAPSVIEYTLHPTAPGLLRFEGLEIRVADISGLFYSRWFVRVPVEYLVLPPLADDEGQTRGVKRFNSLPPPGVHRLRRPGSGSELLDLRDYRPGDPPKMIAWKASARRDRLITKEFESDVPLRCVIFLDTSNSAHVGPDQRRPITKLGSVAAALAQAAAANRDLVGLTLFDSNAAERVAPARTRLHMIQLLRKIAHAIGQLPDAPHTDADLLARYSFPIAQQYYPELLSKSVNSRPFGLFWLPIVDSRWFWLLLVFFFSPALLARPEARELLAQIVLTFTSQNWSVAYRLIAVVGLLSLPITMTVLLWWFHGIRGLLPPRSVRTSRRKQLATLFSTLDNSQPIMIERYLRDDAAFSVRAKTFLNQHRIPLPMIMTGPNGEELFREPQKVVTLANAMARAVSLARDNEQYVILADFTSLSLGDVEPLTAAIRMARARHHQVIVLLSWPADVPEPNDDPMAMTTQPVKLASLVKQVVVSRHVRHFKEIRSALARVGATVLRVDQRDAIPLVLERLEQLRAVRVRR